MPKRRSARALRVAIIGAGPGGIAMGAKLKKLGIEQFTIFEQSDSLGGTWHDSTFPGAAVDTAQPFYSFSFSAFDFTRNYVKQPELLSYLEHTADSADLGPHFRFGVAVKRIEWDEATHSYTLITDSGETDQFHVVVSAVGLLNHPKYPDWPGLDKFQGIKFHSARWEHEHDLSNKRVAVVGTGSTSAQVVPAIAPVVGELFVFQRQPGWVEPKNERVFSPSERKKFSHAYYRRWIRLRQRFANERRLRGAFKEGTKTNKAAQLTCEEFIESVFKDRPDLKKLVTPDYPYGGKRPVKDSDFYPALLRDNVELVPHAVTEVTEQGIIDDTGLEREIDVLVMCTGFQPANYLATFEVVGMKGKTIHEVWNGDPVAYLGLAVAGFPNFYMLYGPNTNGGPIMYFHEKQVEFVAGNLKRMIRENVSAIEVRKSFMDTFNRVLQRRLKHHIVANHPDVRNYGRSASGKNVIWWMEGMSVYAILTKLTRRISSSARRLRS